MKTLRKQFYQICGINATNEDFTNEGFKVISFGTVKKNLVDILRDKETANKFHLWNKFIEPNNIEMNNILDKLENIVFKECRGNSHKRAIGWENGASYLQYHSGIHYKWF